MLIEMIVYIYISLSPLRIVIFTIYNILFIIGTCLFQNTFAFRSQPSSHPSPKDQNLGEDAHFRSSDPFSKKQSSVRLHSPRRRKPARVISPP